VQRLHDRLVLVQDDDGAKARAIEALDELQHPGQRSADDLAGRRFQEQYFHVPPVTVWRTASSSFTRGVHPSRVRAASVA